MGLKLSRREFLKAGAAAGMTVVGGAMLAGCASSSSSSSASSSSSSSSVATASSDLLPAKIGYWGGTCEAPIMVAEAKGFYEECGVDAEVFQITSGTAELIANNDIDFFEATPNFLPSMYQGLKIKFVDNIHTGCIQGIASPDSGIVAANDSFSNMDAVLASLAGKKIGMFSEGDMAQLFIQAEMKQKGMDYDTTEWMAYSDGGASMAFKALQSGELDALTWFDPYGEIGYLAGYPKFFNNAKDPIYKDTTCCFLAATENIINSNPEVVRRVVAAMQMARDYLTTQPAEAAQVIQDSQYVSESDTVLSAYGVKDTSEDLHERLIKSYTWCAGDKAMFDKSAKENWSILYYGTDLMTDAPATWGSGSEYDAYIDDLVSKNYEYFGDVTEKA